MAEKIDGESSESDLLLVQDFIREGDRLFQQQRWKHAAEQYERAVSLQPRIVLVLCKLGQVLLRLKLWDEAEVWFKQALTTNSQSHLAIYGLAEVSIGRKNWAVAVDYLNQTISLNPGFVSLAYLHLGIALQHLQRWDKAISAYCWLLQHDQNFQTYERLALALCQQATGYD